MLKKQVRYCKGGEKVKYSISYYEEYGERTIQATGKLIHIDGTRVIFQADVAQKPFHNAEGLISNEDRYWHLSPYDDVWVYSKIKRIK